jgi:hypothetical protein
MTPFERAEKNIRDMAIKMNLQDLIIQTIEDTKGMNQEEADKVWEVILLMLESADMMGDAN